MNNASTRRRFLVPEVIQNASIDCGPACMKAAFAGYGVELDYEALRDLCQTDIDGTSLHALERVANQLGLVAQQIWVPVDHLIVPEIAPLPAICVVQLPGSPPHFVLVWRQVGPLFQIMDPGAGRRWIGREQLAAQNFRYELDIDASVWRDWANTPEFQHAIGVRLKHVLGDEALLAAAKSHSSTMALSCLDAAIRMVDELANAGGVRRGDESRALLSSLYRQALVDVAEAASGRSVPESFYSALPIGPRAASVRLRGAIVLRFRGRRSELADSARVGSDAARAKSVQRVDRGHGLWLEVLRVLRRDGASRLALLGGSIAVAAMFAFIEVLLLRAILDVGGRLYGPGQRLSFLLLILAFIILASILEASAATSLRGVGRRLELRLRADFLRAVPLLGHVYLRSRPPSDLAHRAHLFHSARNLPLIAGRILRAMATLLVTMAALVWFDPDGWARVLLAGLVSFVVPWLGQQGLAEKDSKLRAHDARLAQFELDALLGLMPIRAHGAERAVRWEYGRIVFEWTKAAKQRLSLSLSVEAVQTLATTLISVLLIADYVQRSADPERVLLLAYWALAVPLLGQELAFLTSQLPRERSLIARLLEPIRSHASLRDARGSATELELRVDSRAASAQSNGAPSEGAAPASEPARGAAIRFRDVGVVVAGRRILQRIEFSIERGEHVAVVGPSGAGKSTLIGLLLGWFDADEGEVQVDGEQLDCAQLRRRTAWVDPAVTLWGRSLLYNVRYGSERRDVAMATLVQQADLLELLGRLPAGLQSSLGEGGRLVSGGEGQRVRLARALARPDADLVLLDEPFRGLERDMRERLLQRARQHWAESTLLCVTHDVSNALDFDRVVVVDHGTVVEQGPPRKLRPGGRFDALLRAERDVHSAGWRDPSWRRMHIENGCLEEWSHLKARVDDDRAASMAGSKTRASAATPR